MRRFVVYKNIKIENKEKERKEPFAYNDWGEPRGWNIIKHYEIKKIKWCEFDSIHRAMESVVTLNHEAYVGRNKKDYEPYFFTIEEEQ